MKGNINEWEKKNTTEQLPCFLLCFILSTWKWPITTLACALPLSWQWIRAGMKVTHLETSPGNQTGLSRAFNRLLLETQVEFPLRSLDTKIFILIPLVFLLRLLKHHLSSKSQKQNSQQGKTYFFGWFLWCFFFFFNLTPPPPKKKLQGLL